MTCYKVFYLRFFSQALFQSSSRFATRRTVFRRRLVTLNLSPVTLYLSLVTLDLSGRNAVFRRRMTSFIPPSVLLDSIRLVSNHPSALERRKVGFSNPTPKIHRRFKTISGPFKARACGHSFNLFPTSSKN